jgi:hypothetical protein
MTDQPPLEVHYRDCVDRPVREPYCICDRISAARTIKPPWVNALNELEDYARELGWKWSDVGHADLIRHLIEDHRLNASWIRLDQAVRRTHPGMSFGVSADGPGYVAWIGGEERLVSAWSVDDPELVNNPDHPSSPAKAIDHLITYLEGPHEG